MTRLLITSGRGPAECRIALRHILRRMEAEANKAGLPIDIAEGADPDGRGPRSAVAIVDGDGSSGFANSWTGSVQWICQSPVRPNHKRRNWFVGIIRLADAAKASREVSASDVTFEALRAGGPGGQHQNKTESAVRAVHRASGFSVVVRDERSQHRNKAVAVERLNALLQLAQEAEALEDKQAIQAQHDQVQRGGAVRRFSGESFKPA